MGDRARGPRLVALAVLALLLVNFPLVALFDVPVRVFGLPLLWAYLFAAWALVIALAAWATRGS